MPASPPVRTPRDLGLRRVAEWAPHRACWLAWPSHEAEWPGVLDVVRREWLALCAAVARPGPDGQPGEALEVLVPDAAAAPAARAALEARGLGARLHAIPFGDIWLRDTAPLFLADGRGGRLAACFRFNGWAGSFDLPGDDRVSGAVAEASGWPALHAPFVLEGGAVDVDGEGTVLTTRQCLLHPGRNPHLDEAATEEALRAWLGVERVVWLDEGLANDHTDGHVDTLARFVAPGRVVCMRSAGPDDPNRDVLLAIERTLRAATDAAGRRLEVVTVPSPGRVEADDGTVLPASYANFYIGNGAVAVPMYGVPHDEAVLDALAPLFPGREVVGVPSRAILIGGGALHCVTQEEPRP